MHGLARNLVINRLRTTGPRAIAPPNSSGRLLLLGGVRNKITAKDTSIGNDPDPALDKSHKEAQSSQSQPEPFSEGHSVPRAQKHATQHHDAHTEQVHKAEKTRAGSTDSGSDLDAVKLSHGENTGKAEAQRRKHATPEGSKFQPGQKGEQVGGHAATNEGPQPGEGKIGKKAAPSTGTLAGMGQALKNAVGKGPASGDAGFHTYSRILKASSSTTTSTPEEAVDKGARKPKDTNVKGAQTPHLPHHNAGEGDSLPAVKNNASLPSKQGSSSGGSPSSASSSSNGNARRSFSTAARLRDDSPRPPAGTSSTPGSRAVDPSNSVHSPSNAPSSGPKAAYTHVVGQPEPDSHQTSYTYSEKSESGHLPSGSAPRSSTSTSPYPEHTTKGAYKDASGIGSSNRAHEEPLKGADEMMNQQQKITPEVGQAGDDAGGRGGGGAGQPAPAGGRAYTVPPDVGEIAEDTLPKPIKEDKN